MFLKYALKLLTRTPPDFHAISANSSLAYIAAPYIDHTPIGFLTPEVGGWMAFFNIIYTNSTLNIENITTHTISFPGLKQLANILSYKPHRSYSYPTFLLFGCVLALIMAQHGFWYST